MAKRYFNWKLAIVLLLGIIILGITAVGLRYWNRSRRAEAGHELGLKAYEEGQWSQAADNLGRYLGVVPDDVDVLFKYAQAQLNIRPRKRSHIQQAVNTYRIILRQDKGNTQAAEKLIAMYQASAPGEAEDIARKALEVKPDPKIHRSLAMALARQRKYQEAAKELADIIERNPDDIYAYDILGQLAQQRPDDASFSAEHIFNEAVEKNPDSAHAYIVRAAYFLRQNQREKALADLARAEKLDLSEPLMLFRLADIHLSMGQYEKAKQHLTEAQKRDPSNELLWRSWAQYALRTDSKSEMLRVAEEGLEAVSEMPWDFMPIAIDLLVQAGQYDRADTYIQKVREKGVAPPLPDYYEGIIAYQQGRDYEALDHFRKSNELGNKSPKLRRITAGVLSRTGDRQSAIQLLRALAVDQPNSFQTRLQLARLLLRNNNWAEAVEQAQLALKINPGNAEAVMVYARAKIKVLRQDGVPAGSPQWRAMEKMLAQLEKDTKGTLGVRLMRFESALLSRELDNAAKVLDDIKKEYPSTIEAAMAEVDLLTARGKEDQAQSKLIEIIGRHPDSVAVVRALALRLAGKGNFTEAEKVVNDAMARFEQISVRRELTLFRVDLCRADGRADDAYQVLKELVGQLPRDVSLKRELLKYKQLVKDTADSQKLVDEIKELEGQGGWQWRLEQARLWYVGDDFRARYAQIVPLLKENLQADPDDRASRLLLAGSYERAGESQLALATYRAAYNRFPRDLAVVIPYIGALQKNNELSEADVVLNQTAQFKLSHPALKGLKLQSYLKRGELDPSITMLEELIKSNPDNQQILMLLASLKSRQGNYEDAELLFDKLYAAQPESILIAEGRIGLKLKQNQSEAAIKICDDLVKTLNTSNAYIVRARTYAVLQKTDQAQWNFDRAAELAPQDVLVWIAKSDFYLSLGRLNEAIGAIEKAISLKSDDPGIQKRAISLYMNSPDQQIVNKGRALLEKALVDYPGDAAFLLYRARSLLARRTRPAAKEAETILRDITEKQPKVADAWLLLGNIALQKKQPGKAVDLALRGLISSPENKALLLLKGRGESARSPALSIPTFKTLVETYPDDINLTLYLAEVYTAAGNSIEAKKLLQEKLTTVGGQADSRRLQIALASAKYKSGNREEALKDLDSLLVSAPDDPAPLLIWAKLLRDDNRLEELTGMAKRWLESHSKAAEVLNAVAGELAATAKDSNATKTAEDIFRLILARDSNNIIAMQGLAILLQSNNRSGEAITLYKKVFSEAPDSIITLNNLVWLLCEENGEYEQALQLAEQGLEKYPDYLDLVDTRGMVYYRMGQYEKAAQDFRRCVDSYPNENRGIVGSYFHLGRVQARLNRKNDALKNINQALDLNDKIGGLTEKDVKEISRMRNELSGGR